MTLVTAYRHKALIEVNALSSLKDLDKINDKCCSGNKG